MPEKSELFYLTETEVMTIDNWIRINQYTLSVGHFQLKYEFSPYGDSVVLCYHRGSKSDCLTVYDDWLRVDLTRTVSQLVVDGVTVNLDLSAEVLKKYFQLGSAATEAHIDADCEPSGFGLSFEIHDETCSIFAGNRLIETQ